HAARLFDQEVEIGALRIVHDGGERFRLSAGYPDGIVLPRLRERSCDLVAEPLAAEAHRTCLRGQQIDLEPRPVEHLECTGHIEHVDLIVDWNADDHGRLPPLLPIAPSMS